MNETPEADSKPRHRWYAPTPGKLVAGLLVVELCLFAADRFSLFGLQRDSGWSVIAAVAILLFVIPVGLVWFVASLVFRRRFQFGIISLFGLMCVVAVVGGWFAWKMAQAKRQAKVVEAIAGAHGWIFYDYQFFPEREVPLRDQLEPRCPKWLLNLVGVDFLSDVTLVTFEHRGEVYGEPTATVESALQGIKHLRKLKSLNVSWTHTTDDHIIQWAGLDNLDFLSFRCTQVTTRGLDHLKELPALETLSLSGPVSPEGLTHLQALPRLKLLYLSLGGISNAEKHAKEVQEALPSCVVEPNYYYP